MAEPAQIKCMAVKMMIPTSSITMSDVDYEQAGQGNDTVKSSVTFTLGEEVENLTLTGSEAIDGAGNSLVLP